MSDNPFDVFAQDLKAAVPANEEEAQPGAAPDQGPINIMAPPAPAPVPVMKPMAAMAMNPPAPMAMGMGGGQPMPMPMGMSMGGMQQQPMGMGAPAPMGQPMGLGAPQQQQQQPMPMPMPMPMMGQPMPMGMPPPAMNGGYGQPPAPSMGMNSGMNMGMGQPQGQPPAPSMGMNMGQPMGMGMAPPAPVPVPAPTMNMGMNGMNGAPNMAAMVPSAQPSNPYGMPAAAPPVPAPSDPWGAAPPAAPAPVPMAAPAIPAPFENAPAPSVSSDPFGSPMGMGGNPAPGPPVPAPAPMMPSDPWGAPPAQPAPGAIVPAPNNAGNDPFGVFNSTPASPQPPAPSMNPNDALSVATSVNGGHDNQMNLNQGQILAAADGGDPWADMGFGNAGDGPAPVPNTAPSGGGGLLGDDALVPHSGTSEHKEGELPPGGEWYDARIFTPTLGVMFFKPQELTDSLFLQTDRSLVNTLDDRPVVAFIVEGSSARAAGVELGHVLLKVNGIDVKNPKEASRLIKEGPRPLPLLFYVPDTTVVVAEGEHMVKYDTRETGAPNSAKDWKPKYVVIGGIIAQPWMMNMYRSKSEYDIAVIETQARRPVSVKVKQFSLQGARVQNDWQGPQMVKYKNKLHPWKYIVCLPISRNPIKISSPNLAQLKPVHEGIRRVLMAQQRHNPHQSRPQQPQQSDPYAARQQQHQQPQQGGGYGGPPPPQQQQQQQYAAQPQQGAYGGPPPQQQQQQYAAQPQQAQPQQGAYGGPPPQQQQQQAPMNQYDQSYTGSDQPSQFGSAGGVSGARRRQAY